jgi:hypothetical protein
LSSPVKGANGSAASDQCHGTCMELDGAEWLSCASWPDHIRRRHPPRERSQP